MNVVKQRFAGALWTLLALSITVGGVALAQTVFKTFGPANGILKGNVSSPITTAATSSDVLSLWSGTCANTTFLRGDGSCQVPPPTTGTGIPGGLNGYVQFNNAGSFSGDNGLVYSTVNDTLTSGGISIPTGAFTWHGFAVSNSAFYTAHAYGTFAGSVSGCPVPAQFFNDGVTCARNSAGNYTLTFSPAYGSKPHCTASVAAAPPRFMFVSVVSTTSATIILQDASLAAVDGTFTVTCMGQQ
jgi:hypothetical protein